MEIFGDYELGARLGSGGMCEVFRAHKLGSDREVALKRLHAAMEEQPEVVDLFLTEADVGVLVYHRNLVHYLDSGEVDGHYWVAMELVDGVDLNKALLKRSDEGVPLDLGVALYIGMELLAGLDHLHQARSPQGRPFDLVHRDVTPDNVFLSRAGEVKLADLGIAKINALDSVTSVLGGMKGKLTFMAPEQVRGERLDGRADQFAAALILYELITGARPFARRDLESDQELAQRVANAEIIPAIKHEPGLPSSLDKALRRALHAKPKKRFDSCGELRDELRVIATDEGLQCGAAELAAWLKQLKI